ncbi:Alkaline phosphatase D precursor [Allorhodopirellula heiligendammensis]|uniref:Alkaline phosphatase D n=2 Tax=Allorhodopirellula heiligendammensis TaxID=2714739 RepID=A0A5C6C2T7_9BACT|nr:Alkaline phosphatase D precursor [Allorhodopirellula heiligendammensis]
MGGASQFKETNMKRRLFLGAVGAVLTPLQRIFATTVEPQFKVTLPEAHKGTLEIDTRLLDSYGGPAANLRRFYLDVRQIFANNEQANFTDPKIVAAAQRNGVLLMGGPLLGDLRDDGVTIWMRPATESEMSITVAGKSFPIKPRRPGETVRIRVDQLQPNTPYHYAVESEGRTIASGRFVTAPATNDSGSFRLAFGSCCHKIGVHNPNLFRAIVNRQPHAMLLLGDIAVDDRNNQVAMHRADYQLRDVSKPWNDLVSHVPVYTAWDDHDYFDNDLSGIPRKFSSQDRDNVREVWRENWNNPAADANREGIYFSTQIGPVEVIMLDTRSCRDRQQRGQHGSYLGQQQMDWLKQTLKNSTAKFKVISSGTMWSDYVSNGKDSWGTWDTAAREEIFSLIEEESIGGVLLVSGDRHGARGFRIPRPSTFTFYEFEPATLGGVSGPPGLVKNCPEQLFGYSGSDDQGNSFVAFGEFTFDVSDDESAVTFRLITPQGDILEEIDLSLSELTPASPDSV